MTVVAMHALITGHTGFKGSWMTLMLERLGHTVSGVALEPPASGIFLGAGVKSSLHTDARHDIRDSAWVSQFVRHLSPDLIIHMAAQPLVRESYRSPRETYEVNVLGTLNVLEAAAGCRAEPAVLIVTSDKVYRNDGRVEGYLESDPLGGHDPYSSSKAMADLLAQSWAASFGPPSIAIARAGNVIGGGDVSQDRLLPDLIRSFSLGEPAVIRNPLAVRPWQHVLDCLTGYLAVISALMDANHSGAWNVGPSPENFRTVGEVADLASESWGGSANWISDSQAEALHEAALLTLNASRARELLGWSETFALNGAIELTVEWEKARLRGENLRQLSLEHIDRALRS